MILGFRTQHNGQPTGFVEKIQSGSKIHTLREDPLDRWQPGKQIQFATGVRTPNYEQFMAGTCKGVQEVRINNHSILTIAIDGRHLMDKAEFTEFVQNDGFETEWEFEQWFAPLIERSWREKGSALYLKLIHWTDKLY